MKAHHFPEKQQYKQTIIKPNNIDDTTDKRRHKERPTNFPWSLKQELQDSNKIKIKGITLGTAVLSFSCNAKWIGQAGLSPPQKKLNRISGCLQVYLHCRKYF